MELGLEHPVEGGLAVKAGLSKNIRHGFFRGTQQMGRIIQADFIEIPVKIGVKHPGEYPGQHIGADT